MHEQNWVPVENVERQSHSQAVPLNESSWIDHTQGDQFLSVMVGGPTRSISTSPIQGNDFPGVYYFDSVSRTETILWAEGETDWRRMAFDLRHEEGRLWLGLFSRDHRSLPDGVHVAAHQRPRRQAPPTPIEALRILIDASFSLWPIGACESEAPDWSAMAQQTLSDLQRDDCRETVEGVRGYTSYVVDGSPRGIYRGTLELFAHTDIAYSLACYQFHAPAAQHAAIENALRELDPLWAHYIDGEHGVLENYYPPRNFGPADNPVLATGDEANTGRAQNSWYQLHNLQKLLALARLRDHRELKRLALRATDRAGELARRYHDLWPLFSTWYTGDPIGGGLDLHAGGIYALCEVEAAALDETQAERRLDAAQRALGATLRLPPGSFIGEPLCISAGMEAAHRMWRDHGRSEARQTRDDLLRLLLMMLYRKPPHTGLFHACGGLLYPAFKENAECLPPLLMVLEDDAPEALPLRRIIEHGLFNNAVYFDDREPRGIPLEDVPTTELPGEAGRIGKEVYGAGQVFDLAAVQARMRRGSAPLVDAAPA